MNRTKLVNLRIELLKQMHKHIIEIGDELIYLDWVALAVPDEPQEDDYEFIAENDNEWTEACILFSKHVKADCEENY